MTSLFQLTSNNKIEKCASRAVDANKSDIPASVYDRCFVLCFTEAHLHTVAASTRSDLIRAAMAFRPLVLALEKGATSTSIASISKYNPEE
jgi:hypothetical protein